MKHTTRAFALTATAVATLVTVAWAGGYLRAQLIDEDVTITNAATGEGTAGTFSIKTNAQEQYNGTVVRADPKERPGLRSSYAYKHEVRAAAHRRAELDNDDWHLSYREQNYWYGFSYFIPDDASWQGDFEQYMGQFRFINTPGGYPDPSCSMYNAAGKLEGGYGPHLTVRNGVWNFHLARPRLNIDSCSGLESEDFPIGSVLRGQWISFIIQAKWRHTEDGILRIWRRNGASQPWELKLEHFGRNWFDKYQPNSWLLGADVKAPNFTVGLYAGSDNKARVLYTDQLRMYSVPTSLDVEGSVHYGRNYVRPEAAPQTVNKELNRTSTTTSTSTTSASAPSS